MGLFIRQNDNRSQYQERLAAELRERAKLQASASDPVDQTKQSNYLKDTEETPRRAWLWAAGAGLIALGIAVYLVVR